MLFPANLDCLQGAGWNSSVFAFVAPAVSVAFAHPETPISQLLRPQDFPFAFKFKNGKCSPVPPWETWVSFGHPVGGGMGFWYTVSPPVAKQMSVFLPKDFAKRKLTRRGHIWTGMKYGGTQCFSSLSSPLSFFHLVLRWCHYKERLGVFSCEC